MPKKTEPDAEEGIRRMVEEVVVTPFFKRHRGHMPATIKLRAEILDEKDDIVLRTDIPNLTDDMIDVSATVNSIDVVLHSGRDVRRGYDEEISLHSSYMTPSPIDPDKLVIRHEGNTLEVKASKLKHEQ